MLMKTPYKTAKELDLTEDQYESLLRTLKFLRDNEFLRKSRHVYAIKSDPLYRFSMSAWRNVHHCGTFCCIGGTSEYLMGQGTLWKTLRQHPVWRLFCPNDSCRLDRTGYEATPTEAADALENYLMFGDPMWEEVLKA